MSYSSTLVYVDADFRTLLPFFADTVAYPEAQLSQFFTQGTEYVSNLNLGILQNANRQAALYYMTAHLQALYTAIVANAGAAPNVEISGRIDKIAVTVQPPIARNQWQQWLGQTPWGQMLLALLQVQSVGGFTIGGLPERAAFRRVFGGFGPGCR